nr:Chain E, Protein mu-NS from Reovirus type 1 [Mammalian orthoreovirus 1 Lang]7BN1_F Chain F, Protein mu-NS from Reovirus type 1 [Mammalian orthoreovirus 1 Lang]
VDGAADLIDFSVPTDEY